MQVGQLPGLIGLNNPELKVGPLRATVYDFEGNSQGFPEVVDDLLFDVGLGSGGETQDGAWPSPSRCCWMKRPMYR